MKDLDAVEQEMYYQKSKHKEDEIRKETNQEKRKQLQEEYEDLRSHVSMKTLTQRMELQSRQKALQKKQAELKQETDLQKRESLQLWINKMQKKIEESQSRGL